MASYTVQQALRGEVRPQAPAARIERIDPSRLRVIRGRLQRGAAAEARDAWVTVGLAAAAALAVGYALSRRG